MFVLSGCHRQSQTRFVNPVSSVIVHDLPHRIEPEDSINMSEIQITDNDLNPYSYEIVASEEYELVDQLIIPNENIEEILLRFRVHTYPQDIYLEKKVSITDPLKTIENNEDPLEREDAQQVVNSETDNLNNQKEDFADVTNDFLILVNKEYKLASDYVPSNLVLSHNGLYVEATTYQSFLKMQEAMAKEGLSIDITSAYRSYNYQEELYNNYVAMHGQAAADTFSARPGHSEHQTGLALDVMKTGQSFLDFGSTEEYLWVKENAHHFGFIIRYTEANEHITGYVNEPWHLRYVGIEAASKIKNEKIIALEHYHR